MDAMLELLHHVLNVVLPVLLCIGVGAVLAWLAVPFHRRSFVALIQYVGYPTLIVSHLSEGHVAAAQFGIMAGAAVAAIVAFVLIGGVFLTLARLPLRAFIAPMSLNNTGNIGLPVAMLAFGDAGLSYAFAFMVVVLLGVFTYGTWVPKGEASLRTVAASPVLSAIALALVLLAFGLELPKPVASAVEILGGMAVPLMLVMLGHTLATLDRSSLGTGSLLAVFHLAMGLGAGFGLAVWLHRHGAGRADSHVSDAGVRGHLSVRGAVHPGERSGRGGPDSGVLAAHLSGAAGGDGVRSVTAGRSAYCAVGLS